MLRVVNNESCGEGCNAIPDGFVETMQKDVDGKLDFMRQKTTEMGYRFVGRHSAIKVCNWTKESIRGKNVCYKNKFYDIESNQCVQMTPAMFFCTFNCLHCWRNFDYILPRKDEDWDSPTEIIDKSIDAQREILQGFGGSDTANKAKLKAAMEPKHFAISLSGEPTLYPHLPAFVDEIISRNMTAFLVSNGTIPDMIERLVDHQPTNMYISFYGTTPEMYKKATAPMVKDFWPRVLQSMSMLNKFDCNTVIRLTLTKGLNFTDPEGYAKIIDGTGAKFIECKSFMSVGGSRRVLPYTAMPLFDEIKDFSEKIEKYSSYRIVDHKKESRVVLLTRE